MTILQKEQADGDFQNLVCVIMAQNNMGLQEAVDTLTEMLGQRVADYTALKKSLPSFGPKVDPVLAKYHKALEHFVQGTIVWYYLSPSIYLDGHVQYMYSPSRPRIFSGGQCS